MAETIKEKDMLELGDRIIRTRYSMDADHLNLVFKDISMSDYMILAKLGHRMGFNNPETRVYLSEISKELDRPINQVSQMVQNLQDKGYVYWEHDPEQRSGTYIYISETGREAMVRQQEILRKYCGNIVERIGRDNVVKILDMMHKLETVMEDEAKKLSDEDLSMENALPA
ncbi:MAG: hypothetical protein LIO75_05800 [Lachnospiraceae bacterium]|nr:hypothetical protein [Lachnospiraceae bacterium]